MLATTTTRRPSALVTFDAELTEHWRSMLRLDGPPSRRTLFLGWLRLDGTPVSLLVPVEELPVEPDRIALASLVEMHRVVAGSEGADPGELHLALCLQRPGPAGLSPDDHAWSSAVDAVLRERTGMDCSMHVGNGRTAVPVLTRSSWPARPLPPERRPLPATKRWPTPRRLATVAACTEASRR